MKVKKSFKYRIYPTKEQEILLAKHLGWGEFVRQLQYKAAWYGREVIRIDRFFPSSKMCSSCGRIKEDLILQDREWVCGCGVVHDRDLNASRNILREGIKIRSGLGIKLDVKQKRVEALPVGESKKPEAHSL